MGLWGVVNYYFSVILLCFCYRHLNDPFNKKNVDITNVRYNVSKIKDQVKSLIQRNGHNKSQPK